MESRKEARGTGGLLTMVYSCNIQQEWYKFRDIDKKHDQFIDNIITDKAKWVEKGT
jgi:hypothetical protein|tara:strand:+ start:137 stop:304 length:168 start_codon:yes stop_codon:yes gene_type:complete